MSNGRPRVHPRRRRACSNLIEYRVRKAHHVYVKEKDMLKYLMGLVLITVTGLIAWTLTWKQGENE